jgi:hypothetical protein
MPDKDFVSVPITIPKWILHDFVACVPELAHEPKDRAVYALGRVLAQEIQSDIEYEGMERILQIVQRPPRQTAPNQSDSLT